MQEAGGRGRRLVPALFGAAFVALYALFPSRGYYDDDVYYAIAAEKGEIGRYWGASIPEYMASRPGRLNDADFFWLGHPHHFLWSYLALAAYRGALLAGYAGRSIDVLELLNSLLALAGLGILYLSLRRALGLGTTASLIGCLFLGVSFGYWNAAVSGGAYCLETVLLIPAFFCMKMLGERRSAPISLAAGVFIGLAALTQKVDFLLLPILAAYLLLAGGLWRAKAANAAICAATALALAGGSTFFVGRFVMGMSSLKSFGRWYIGYRVEEYVSLSPSNPLLAAAGQLRALCGAGFLKAWALGKEGTVSAGVFALLAAAAASAAAFLILRSAARRREASSGARRALSLAFVWALVFLLFFTIYAPGNQKFYLRNIVPAAVAIAIACDIPARGASRARAAGWCGAACLLAVNLFGSIMPQSMASRNDDFQYARFIAQRTPPGSVVVFPGGGESSTPLHLVYFGAREVHLLEPWLREPELLDRELRRALSRGVACYAADDERRVSASRVYASFHRERGRRAVPAPEDMRAFFARRGYALEGCIRYEEPSDYLGNLLCRITKRTMCTR